MPRSTHVCLCALAFTATAVGGDRAALASCDAHPPVIVFNDNGGWSWFEDERAVVDTSTGTLLVSSVANAASRPEMRRSRSS